MMSVLDYWMSREFKCFKCKMIIKVDIGFPDIRLGGLCPHGALMANIAG